MIDPIIDWKFLSFQEIENVQLYAILRLRSEVFVVEQNCVYQDMDNKDLDAMHLCGWENSNLVAYVRILAPGVSYTQESSIGRVCTSKESRNKCYGKSLMLKAIKETLALYPAHDIKIGAQVYLTKFYSDLGFKVSGSMYLEDGIEHQEMKLALSSQ